MGNECCRQPELDKSKSNSLPELTEITPKVEASIPDERSIPSPKTPRTTRSDTPTAGQSTSDFPSKNSLSSIDRIKRKTNAIQLYKPIYVTKRSNKVRGDFAFDEGDEFELASKVDEDYLTVIHLRTGIEHKVHRTSVRLDPETPLRLGSDDRGVIQRCLLQHNVPGAYLVRRSKSVPNAFVLSVSQVSNQRNAEDWQFLIHIHPTTHRFYFEQEPNLQHLSFSSFQELTQHVKVREVISLSTVVPFRIEFEVDLWHIARRDLTLKESIGKGQFGEVWRGIWKNGDRSIPVAVKRLHLLRHDQKALDGFMREIETMKILRNNFIVTLHGVAVDPQTNETLLVTELLKKGDLKKWLKARVEVPEEKIIASFAFDICRGMAFIEKNFLVHRDLACRNLLLGDKGDTVKIADFGLSTFVNENDFEKRKEAYLQMLPLRWTAPEVLNDRLVYSIKSDVWSFGIVLIEIWLKGENPYTDEKDLASVRALVSNGYVHKRPKNCSKQFYNRLILPCLAFEPNERASFKALADILRDWIKEKAEYDRLSTACIEFST